MSEKRIPHTVLIMGSGGMYGRYGTGEDVQKAKARFRREGGELRRGYTIVRFYEGTEYKGVDQMGYVHYTGPEPESEEVRPR